MIENGGGYLSSPYESAPFPNLTNSFPVRPSSIPSYLNPSIQDKQPQSAPRTANHSLKTTLFKLYDYETNGESDIIRLIFAFAGVPFKDKRLKQEEWKQLKERMLFDQLPILRVNHQLKIVHRDPILRFLAREFHLYGTGAHDHIIVDIVFESVRHFQEQILEQSKSDETLRQWLTDHHASIYLNQLEKLHQIFSRHGPFYLGSHVSIADLLVYRTIDSLMKIDPKLLDDYTHLKQARRRVEKHPQMINYLHISRTQNPNSEPKSSRSHRQTTKSPTPNTASHRHRSHDGHKSSHHHHHHHHRHRHYSKEPPVTSRTQRTSIRSSRSPSISTQGKEQTSTRSVKSPSISAENHDATPRAVHSEDKSERTAD